MEPEKKSNRRIGSRTLQFASPVAIKAWATVAGRKENEGQLTGQYD